MYQSKFISQTEPQMTEEGTDPRETRMTPAEAEGGQTRCRVIEEAKLSGSRPSGALGLPHAGYLGALGNC